MDSPSFGGRPASPGTQRAQERRPAWLALEDEVEESGSPRDPPPRPSILDEVGLGRIEIHPAALAILQEEDDSSTRPPIELHQHKLDRVGSSEPQATRHPSVSSSEGAAGTHLQMVARANDAQASGHALRATLDRHDPGHDGGLSLHVGDDSGGPGGVSAPMATLGQILDRGDPIGCSDRDNSHVVESSLTPSDDDDDDDDDGAGNDDDDDDA